MKNTKPTAPAKKTATKAPAKKVAAKKVAAKKAAPEKVPAKKVTNAQRPSAKIAEAAKKVAAPVVEPVAPVAPPAPVVEVVIPKDVPPPEKIELVHEGKAGQGKRYVSKTEPDSKYHLRDRSEAEKPVSIVRRICNDNLSLDRKSVIALCIKAGVNKNTAATQYSLWKAAKAKADAAAANDESDTED